MLSRKSKRMIKESVNNFQQRGHRELADPSSLEKKGSKTEVAVVYL